MPRLFAFILIVLAVLLLSGAVFVAVWDVPAPVSTVEKVLPDEMLGK